MQEVEFEVVLILQSVRKELEMQEVPEEVLEVLVARLDHSLQVEQVQVQEEPEVVEDHCHHCH